ncbi:nitroreductase [Pelobium manganitolerans]|uniref:Putative NAD(P)H nitroreductase n=1 Tax=Pelobium manganitolerans TaxID=1842495 RepID=A0A419S4H3_9SPHI|nr:nitroreductase [Pelobium manganitolerans]RKD15022.1 nitroreductase [Pelobium manganitolerans]
MSNKATVLSEIIKGRRSVFPESFINKAIPKAVIEQILESANYAPTHKLTQPWRFTVIVGEARQKLGEELGRLYQQNTPADKFLQKKYDSFAQKTSQSAVIIAINVALSGAIPEWEELAAAACAVQNMALTAQSLDVGAYWSSPPLIDDLGHFLGLAPNEKCIGLFYMGYHDAPAREAKRSPMSEKVKWMG